tara:strand:+ start:1052 stop:2569 length:1518 start_codon:yes stop_codon:yes gene_type:complete
MALISPGVESIESNLTNTINNASTGRAALVGQFSWGSNDTITKITNESELVAIYGEPTDLNFMSFFSAANFLSYGNDLRVLRATNSDATKATYGLGTDLQAKYVGEYGNRLSLEIFASEAALSSFSKYYPYALQAGEVLIIVRLDGNVVETHFGSTTSGTLDIYNNSLYIVDVLERSSNYIEDTDTGESSIASSVDTFMSGGDDGETGMEASYISGWDAFQDRYEIYANLFLAGDAAEVGDAVVTKIKDVMELRQDALAIVSPRKVDVVDAPDIATAISNIVTYKDTTLNITSTYVTFDGNFKYQFDKYNDKFRWVPLNGDIGGLCVYTDDVSAPWFSPAGVNRGQIRNVTRLALSTNQSHRDTLYESAINPVVSFTGQGFFLFGDKTASISPTAFGHINVRRLFNTLKKAISDSSQYKLFELNDNFTRVSFKSEIDQYLQSIKSQRGIVDFYTVVDTNNNTPQVIDSNEFVADIYIKPPRSINFIQLNFIAVGSGVDFNELLTR